MRWSVVWSVLGGVLVGIGTLGGVGCTTPNPRSCADGLCSDPGRPFCDVDGALEGTPQVCVPVSCSASEFVACRNDEVIRCNAAGNNYDLVACTLGCSVADQGCVKCDADTDCVNPAPICDASARECRGCRADDECASEVCALESGTCLAPAEVVYASPAGSTTGSCSPMEPCSVARAITVVTTSGGPRTLRLLPGTYSAPIAIQGPVTVNAVATGAELGTTSGLSVLGGATVEVRGLTVKSSTLAGGSDIVCGDQSDAVPKSSLTIRDSVLAVASPSAVLRSFRCNLRMEASEVAALTGGIRLNTDSTFEGDRLHMHGTTVANTSSVVSLSGSRTSARLTNSLVENMGAVVLVATSDTIAPGSQAFFAFNTFVFVLQDGAQGCDYSTSYMRDIRFENNIFFATSSANVTYGPDWPSCGLANNVLFPQADARLNNVVANPTFVDAAAKDYRLQAGSPAVDTAVPSTGLSTTHDFTGAVRPQGPAPDIGAFERTP